MGNLIKMDIRRLFLSKVFYIAMAITAVLNFSIYIVTPILSKFFTSGQNTVTQELTEIISQPFPVAIFMVTMIISAVSFAFADIANGYIKNIAGQIKRKSDTIVSKFIVLGFHNFIFMLVSMLSCMIAAFAASATGFEQITVSGNLIFPAILTFLIKWMLSMAIISILLFITTGIKNKTIASVFGVILSTGALGMVYFGLNEAIKNIFKVTVSIGSYTPDSLIDTVSVGQNIAVLNAIIVSIVFSALFLALTIKVFNSRNVK